MVFIRTLAVCLAIACAAGCLGQEVNCENLCAHTLACEVSFSPADDADGKKLASGERTDAASCALGCEENPRVTVDAAKCVDAVPVTTPEQCQAPVLACLGVSAIKP